MGEHGELQDVSKIKRWAAGHVMTCVPYSPDMEHPVAYNLFEGDEGLEDFQAYSMDWNMDWITKQGTISFKAAFDQWHSRTAVLHMPSRVICQMRDPRSVSCTRTC